MYFYVILKKILPPTIDNPKPTEISFQTKVSALSTTFAMYLAEQQYPEFKAYIAIECFDQPAT